MAVVVVPHDEPTKLARWAYRSLLERLARVADELRLELRAVPGDDPATAASPRPWPSSRCGCTTSASRLHQLEDWHARASRTPT
jgi:hypothetical protein